MSDVETLIERVKQLPAEQFEEFAAKLRAEQFSRQTESLRSQMPESIKNMSEEQIQEICDEVRYGRKPGTR